MRRLTVLLLTTVLYASAHAQPPTVFTYQGKLTDGGAPANGLYDFQFRLFAGPMGGNPIGSVETRHDVQVTNGVFTVQLDFGQTPFTSTTNAANYLEIAVRPGASTGGFQQLLPRNPITSSPYAVQSIRATQADIAGDSHKLGGVNASEYVTNSTTSFIRNQTTQQPLSNFSISGDGAVGGNLSVGASAAASPYRLDVAGPLRAFSTGPSDINVQTFGGTNSYAQFRMTTPNRRWLIGTSQNFNGDQFYLMDDTAGNLRMTIQPNNGAIAFPSGNVGIGTTVPSAGRLHVHNPAGTGIYSFGGPSGSYGVFGESTNGSGLWGRSANGAGVAGQSGPWIGVYGESNTYQGVHGVSAENAGVVGVGKLGGVYGESTNGNAVWGRSLGAGPAMLAEGNAVQSRDKGGWAKAMLLIQIGGQILRCYNSQGGPSATVPCNISVQILGTSYYRITFNFPVNDRFILTSNATLGGGDLTISAWHDHMSDSPSQLRVVAYSNGVPSSNANFFIFVF